MLRQNQRMALSLIGGAALTLVAAASLSQAQGGTNQLAIEREPKYLPAGPGQKPWDVTRHLIPLSEVQSGGPPRDGIPALNFPAFIPAAEASALLKPSDVVLGVSLGGAAKAYPVRILNWHEVVNDQIAGKPLLVSW